MPQYIIYKDYKVYIYKLYVQGVYRNIKRFTLNEYINKQA